MVVVRVVQVRQRSRGRTFVMVRPWIPGVIVRLVARRAWGWRREAAALWVLWAAGQFGGAAGSGGGLVAVVGLLVVVGVVGPVRRPVVGWLRGGRLRRGWAAGCRGADLFGWMARTPPVRRVRRVPAGEVLTVRLLPGQEPADFAAAADRLAASMRVRSVSVVRDPDDAGLIRVLVARRLTLREIVRPAPLPATPDVAGLVAGLDGLVVGEREDGGAWRLPLRGSHVLVAGATGAGKGSVLWSTVRALAPAVDAGLVELWGVDPKGMELSFGPGLFSRLAVELDDIAVLLDDAVGRLRERKAELSGVTRLHVPAVGSPLIVLVIDEFAALTGYVPDPAMRRRIAAALGVLLSQGRAPGVVVVGAVQDPRKDVLPLRDLFPIRVALRMTEPNQVDLVLGDGARARGALADRIPPNLPGVGYVLADGDPLPVRVRAAHISDEDIAAINAQYGGWVPDIGDVSDGAAGPGWLS